MLPKERALDKLQAYENDKIEYFSPCLSSYKCKALTPELNQIKTSNH